MSASRKESTGNSILHNEWWYNEFADKLLSENFLLTALEFYAELTETGKEIPKLKEFFSNPGNFEQHVINKAEIIPSVNLPRSSSQATLDSLDLTRYSEDGEKTVDDRVAVLEFELRKARETINSLRTNLTEAAESETNKTLSLTDNSEEPVTYQIHNVSIRPHEQRALNFLINEYLLLHGYKLTSITFADENENQDFEDWDDVGLNSTRPVGLLYLYREGLKGIKYSSCIETKDFECQVELNDELSKSIQIKELETEIAHLSNKIISMELEYSKKINNLESQKTLEGGSQKSCSSEQEYFEMIEVGKSNEGSETKSDKSNGDWTKIGIQLKKENLDYKTVAQYNFETVSTDDRVMNQFVLGKIEKNFIEVKNTDDFQDEVESQLSADGIKPSVNFVYNIYDEMDSEMCDHLSQSETCLKLERDSTEVINLINGSRSMPEKFKKKLMNYCDIFICSNSSILGEKFNEQFINNITKENIVEVISNSLPKIVPNIILNKREEIIPVLVLSICLNPDPSVRDKLLNLLFNLKKKPQMEERGIILQSLLKISQIKGSDMVENEILPQIWEQITHKYTERRILAAESCFVLASYVSETIRNSLIISIVQQLLQDKEECIRKAAIKILTLLIALTSDEHKYDQFTDICIQVLSDESMDIMNVVNDLLFPVLAQWSFSLRRVQSDLYQKLLSKCIKQKMQPAVHLIKVLLPYLLMTIADADFLTKLPSQSFVSTINRKEFYDLYQGLCDPMLFYNESVEKLMTTLDLYTSKSNFSVSEWFELNWIENTFILQLLEAGDNFWEDVDVMKPLTISLRYLCLGLGKNITNRIIKPFLLEKLMECENAVVSGREYKCSIIPLYLVGVLSTFPEELQEMSNTLRRFICALPLCGVSLIPLEITLEILSQYQSWQILILDAVWEGVVHQRPLVRSGSASLLQYIIPHTPNILVNTKIVPALVTLTSDPEPSVKTSAVPALGMLTSTNERGTKDKVYMTFHSLLNEGISSENHNLIIQLVRTLGHIYESCELKFREEVVIPQLSSAAVLATHSKNKDLVEVLTNVFSTVIFSPVQLQLQCISSSLLPGLRALDNLCLQLNLPYTEHMVSMIKEVERRLSSSTEYTSKSSIKSPSDAKRLANAVVSNIVVEDVRNRVTKMFNSKPNSLQNVSGIFKKKT